ncbi:hypothetical protein MH050_08425 [Bacillus licheniformis]|uniref:hypothetical protein n=1 Tax=Bacillus subtilis group TaxID=653685 RepID=UPI00018C7FEE|nr:MULTISPECIES: hypothetical protein [Bacillus subtilis group]MBU5327618.1 hypothetical protein [Bacillus paralicheniformis]MCY7740878.1 hypothetical protein [Bacillus licheniformis]MDH3162321.1 hypothetical protein [Bacillus licheniformis]QDL76937.1 hypothetical protein D9Y32_05455 [Bacillus licheniformis]
MKVEEMTREQLQADREIFIYQTKAFNDELQKANYDLTRYKAMYTLKAKEVEDLTLQLKELQQQLNQKQPKAAK